MNKDVLRWTVEPTERKDVDDNNTVIDHLHHNLSKTRWLKYIYDRKINVDSIRAFNIGAFTTSDVITGTDNSDTGTYPLRGRLIIPIYDAWGTPVSLVGRSYPTATSKSYAKYLPVPYPKSKYLYNLNNAKTSIYQKKFAFMVEGFFDVITLWQQGIENVVCTQGTSISKIQASLLRRYTNTVGYIPDNDPIDAKGNSPGEEGYTRVKSVLESIGADFDVVKIENTTKYADMNDMLMHGDTEFFDWLKGFEVT